MPVTGSASERWLELQRQSPSVIDWSSCGHFTEQKLEIFFTRYFSHLVIGDITIGNVTLCDCFLFCLFTFVCFSSCLTVLLFPPIWLLYHPLPVWCPRWQTTSHSFSFFFWSFWDFSFFQEFYSTGYNGSQGWWRTCWGLLMLPQLGF